MADVTDVTSTLVGIISGLLYPSGLNKPSSSGFEASVFPGWPIPESLSAAIGQDRSQISVYPRHEEHNTTRYTPNWQVSQSNVATITLSIAGQTVTVGGSVPTAAANNPHTVMVLANGAPYLYSVQPTDTLSTIATALATLIAIGIAGTTSSGAVITLPNSARVQAARVGVLSSSVQEVRRQEKLFQIGIWSPSPSARSALAKVIDPVLAFTTFLNLPDLTAGRLRYVRNFESDETQKQRIYRRDLFYTVEYGTTNAQSDGDVIVTQLNITPEVSGSASTPVVTVYD